MLNEYGRLVPRSFCWLGCLRASNAGFMPIRKALGGKGAGCSGSEAHRCRICAPKFLSHWFTLANSTDVDTQETVKGLWAGLPCTLPLSPRTGSEMLDASFCFACLRPSCVRCTRVAWLDL